VFFYWLVEAFDHAGNALPQANAQADQGVPTVAAFQLTHRAVGQAGTGSTQRVTDGNGAAIGVQAWVIERQIESFGTAEYLRSEGFVDFDQIHIGQLQIGALAVP